MQITRTTPLRLMILQLRQIFFTDARTFISSLRMANLSVTALAAVTFKIRFFQH